MTKRSFIPARRFLKPSVHTLLMLSLFNFCWLLSDATALGIGKQAEAARELLPNTPVERELQAAETHLYKITLAEGTYLRLSITPQEIFVKAQFLAPNSDEDVGAYISLTGTGLKTVTAIAESAGSYRLAISQADNSAPSGHYEVKIEELRPATAKDRTQFAAERAESEGYMLTEPRTTAEEKHQGIAKYEVALQLWRQLGEHKAELRMLAHIAITYRETGDVNMALKYAEQAIQTARALGDRYQEANLNITFGLLYQSLGEYQKALDTYRQARQLFKGLSARYGEAITFVHIGSVLAALGDLQEGLRYLSEALPTFSSLGDEYGESGILNTMGNIYRQLGDPQKGIEFHNRALALARKYSPIYTEAYSLVYLGSAYLELGDWQKAREFAEQAVKLSRTLGHPIGEGNGLKLIGDAAYLSGDYQKALDFLKQALQVFHSLWERDREAKTLHSLARVNTALGNFEEAKKQIEQAIEIQESMRANVISQQLRETIFSSAQASFALYIDLLQQLHKKDPTAGFDAKALQVSERARARSLLDLLSQSQANIRQGVAQNLLELERTLQQQINAKAATRTRLLSDKRTQAQAASFDKEITELTARYRDVEVQIRQSSPRYAALTQPQPLSAKEIQQQLDDQTVLLEFALGDKQSWLWAVTRASVSSYPLPASNVIESSARKVYELLTAWQPKKDETQLLYRARIADAEGKLQSESARLSQLLLGQIAAKLQSEWKGKRLAIVATGALEYVPFAALPIPGVGGQRSGVRVEESGVDKVTGKVISKDPSPTSAPRPLTPDYRPLIAEHEIVNLPSVSALAAIRRETAGRPTAEKTIAVIADPVFELSDPRVLSALKKSADHSVIASVRSDPETQTASENQTPATATANANLMTSLKSFTQINERGGFSRLPFSREEAEAITSLAAKHSLMKATDFQATRSVATSGELARFRIVHFATHGLLNSERPELSGLVLSLVDESGKAQDGFLRMHEIYNLNLPADLIVLSACQTALGKQIRGEGLVGLTRGFMYAGAERVVASLWQVDDLATAELMKKFYRSMLKEGKRPSEALRAAQLEMLKQSRWSAPYFWAAFTIQGEWR